MHRHIGRYRRLKQRNIIDMLKHDTSFAVCHFWYSEQGIVCAKVVKTGVYAALLCKVCYRGGMSATSFKDVNDFLGFEPVL